jgi:hypothetical protein
MKKICAILTAIIITLVSLLSLVSASDKKTVFYLNYGNVIISDTAVSGYDINGNVLNKTDSNGYVVTQADSSKPLDYCITVSSGSQNVELLNVNIARSGSFDFAVNVESGANANLTISGENHIYSGLYRAGIDIAQTASAVINGDGILYASSEFEAGIGGGNGKSNGSVTINSGTIYATGGISGYSAGIGGGTSGNGGNITINGGTIVAVGGDYAAGIGGGNLKNGGNITINGGTITAKGGLSAAGIGGGYLGNGGNIVINSGSVKATAGTGGTDIGNGQNCSTVFSGIKNSANNSLTKVIFTPSVFTNLYIDGIDGTPITSKHENDNSLYFYLSDGTHIVSVADTSGGIQYYKVTVSNGSSEIASATPINFGNFKTFGNKVILTGKIDDISVQSGFSLKSDSDLSYGLYYGNIKIGTYNLLSLGDINADGKVNSLDALIALQITTGYISADELQFALADMNSDSKISSYDALLILYKSVS